MKVAILDGYVDEPSCLGVPPYIAPYPRYIYGMLRNFKVVAKYLTIDHLRDNPKVREELKNFDLLIIVGGIAVPGKYLGGRPLEKRELFSLNFSEKNVFVGPMAIEFSKKEIEQLRDCNIDVLMFPFEKELFKYLCNFFKEKMELDLDKFSILGAEVVKQHPDYPYVICEIETYRGCYWGKCSFCIERFQGFWMRSAEAVLSEIKALYDLGVRYFRLGRQTDFYTYLADFSYEIPKPDHEKLKNFHRAIWQLCPKIKTLHLDNVNPKTLATYPEESKEITKTIVTYQTPGNIAAMGLESADERVIKKNTLCATVEEVMTAVEIINEYGSAFGYNGLPSFLPGINFVIGLKGETKETFEKNLNFLEEILEKGLLVRRINIRQVKILPGTPMEKVGYSILKKHKKYFRIFKNIVREKIDVEMLRRVIPKGRKITDLRVEIDGEKISFARQLATYPILVGLVGKFQRNSFLDGRVVDHGSRSITAVKIPLDLNRSSFEELKMLLGEGKAKEIVKRRPFKDLEEVKSILGREVELLL
ncbi:MAG: radical SAM protein [Archaeoglobaceae archaeon]|nr:radical SAM protein [Archaeoglobaceae archaeon]MCX8151631.1 radical SAM protein [Archaeoglobaceae archaeon]MDW8013091.1 radical SAM protein [Archaeoglobaceae archaeon]